MRGGRGRAPKSASDALLKAAVGSMPYGFSIWSEDLTLVLFNDNYLALYGFSRDEVRLGMSLREMCALTIRLGNHPDVSADELYEVYAQRLEDCAASGEALKVQKAIRGRFIKTTHVRSPGLGWIVMHEDVTGETEQQWLAELREKTLAAQGRRFNAAVDNMSHGLSIFDADMRLVTCNRSYLEIYGLPDSLGRSGTPLRAIVEHRRGAGTLPAGIDDYVERATSSTGVTERYVETNRLLNERVIQITRSPVEGGGFVAIHQDITEDVARLEALKASREEAARQNMRFEAAVNNMSQGLCMFDRDERLVICNEPYARMYNLPPELMRPGTTLSEILEFRFAHGMVPKQGRDAYVHGRKRLVSAGLHAKDEIELEDGRVIAIQHHPMGDGGWVATHEDVTEQRRIEARVRHLARHDPLTDLPNRVFVREEAARLESHIRRGEKVAVLCLDLDHFKAVNDTLGHGIGDRVLVTVAERLREAARETDIVSRLGGDEFAILIHDLEHPQDAAAVADRIVRAVAQPMEIEGHHIATATSIGVAVAPSDGQDVDTLLKNADMALYRAKSEGRGTYHFFEKGMDEAVQRRRLLEQGLKVALARNEFRLVYQPLFDLEQNSVSGFEALLRWDHPERGLISPAEFVPVAEETGIINPIGEWVLREACDTAAGWPGGIHIAVNLSPVQFKSRNLVDVVSSALAEAALDPSRLELEITESLLLADTEQTLGTLHRLREIGVHISMDDFGTGYSSLSYLRSFPFDKIKIDRSFMAGIGSRQESLAIIKAVIDLGQSLGMSTTAEGIETEEQLAAVRDQGCREVQGFLFSPPLPASGVAELLRAREHSAVPVASRRRRRG